MPEFTNALAFAKFRAIIVTSLITAIVMPTPSCRFVMARDVAEIVAKQSAMTGTELTHEVFTSWTPFANLQSASSRG
jgi:hypothetical protein